MHVQLQGNEVIHTVTSVELFALWTASDCWVLTLLPNLLFRLLTWVLPLEVFDWLTLTRVLPTQIIDLPTTGSPVLWFPGNCTKRVRIAALVSLHVSTPTYDASWGLTASALFVVSLSTCSLNLANGLATLLWSSTYCCYYVNKHFVRKGGIFYRVGVQWILIVIVLVQWGQFTKWGQFTVWLADL